jgi:transposase InsO family protein
MAGASGSSLQPQIPIFNGKNYDYWSIKMKTLFCSQDVWDLVENGFPEPADQQAYQALSQAEKDLLKENKKKDSKALFFIQQAMEESIFPKVAAATRSKQAWESLQTTYQGTSKVKTTKLQILRRDFENLQMKDTDSIDSFFTHAMAIINLLRSYGETVGDQKVVEKILRSLPTKFDPVVIAIEESKDLTQLSVDELMGSLLSHEQRLNRTGTSSLENAFKTQLSFGRTRGRSNYNRGRGRFTPRGGRENTQFESRRPASSPHAHSTPTRGRGSSHSHSHHQAERYDKSNIQCHYCNKFGHFASECRKKQYDMNKQKAHFTNENQPNNGEENTILITCNVAQESSKEVWFLDSGCSNHMSGSKEMFATMDDSIKSEVKLGNDHRVSVMGKGSINIRTKQGEEKHISDVYYVPGLQHNLISIGQLVQKGYRIYFENGECVILDKKPSNRLIAKVEMTKNRMFPLRIQSELFLEPQGLQKVVELAFKASYKNESWLWHLRLGHLNFKGLQLLYKKRMVYGLPPIEPLKTTCESCILAKQHRKTFPVGESYREKHPLEIVHSDLCGPMQTPSISGRLYFLTFIDDFSRKVWVYFLKYKSDVFVVFKEFKAKVEKESGYYIKTLRTDHGGEYISNDFHTFCKENGIRKQFTARYTPQQNGVAERKNRTIMEMARSMIKEKQLPNEYWVEVVACSVYILNRCPTKAVINKTPEEAWSKRKHNITHLRVFGCVAYSLIPQELRKKLDDRGEKCIFVGYSEQSKAYKLYNPITKKLIISRDVEFVEEEAWDGSIDKRTTTIASVPQGNEENETQIVNPTTQENVPTMPSKAPTTPNPTTPTYNNNGESSNPTLASLRSRSINTSKKTHSLREIYDETQEAENDDLCSNFAFLT